MPSPKPNTPRRLLTKNQYLLGFAVIVAVLWCVRQLLPVNESGTATESGTTEEQPTAVAVNDETTPSPTAEPAFTGAAPSTHRIRGVHDYQQCFPDSQALQIVAANRWGVKPVRNRADAEQRMRELVYVGESPYYHVDRLYSSIPYLVPRAALLLQDIGQAFFDSLYVKGVPLQQLIVTSVLRSMDDVAKLQRRNGNATTNSCHLYGTTFDICYNRYQPVGRSVRDDTLKWVLSEVLRDKRQEGRCYIKYEVKQGCFHLTVR